MTYGRQSQKCYLTAHAVLREPTPVETTRVCKAGVPGLIQHVALVSESEARKSFWINVKRGYPKATPCVPHEG